MVRHVIIWTLSDDLTDEQKADAKLRAKQGLEGLKGRIDGLESIEVHINGLESSNGDMMLDSSFTDEAALKAYQTNPDHLEVAKFIRTVVSDRKCLDYTV